MKERLKKYAVLAGIVLVALFAFLKFRSCDKKKDTKTSSEGLNPGVVQKVIINPVKHTVTIVTPTKTETLFLPDRPSSIEINKEGETRLTSPQWGTELRPYAGLGFSEHPRLYLGVDWFYFKRFDTGVFLSEDKSLMCRAGLSFSYTVYDNLRATFGYGGNAVHFILSVRL